MSSILIDTNILVDHLRGMPSSSAFLESMLTDGIDIYCSVVTRIELYAGMRHYEENMVKSLLKMFQEVAVDIPIADSAGRYMNLFMKSHSLTPADAILAATAKCFDATLFTLNIKHFPMADIEVRQPY